MNRCARRHPHDGVVGLGVTLIAASAFAVPFSSFAVQETPGDECLIEVHNQSGNVADGSTLCQVASGKICTFNLELCRNQPGCIPATFKKTIRATGLCNPGKLAIRRAQSPCGAFTGVKVRTKRKGKRIGTCDIHVVAKSSDRPPRKDVDKITLVCMLQGSQCPNGPTTTTTTLPRCGNGMLDSGEQCDPPGSQSQCPAGQACDPQCQCATVSCAPIVPGQPIDGTYQTLTLPATDPVSIKLCTPQASANLFQPCSSDADCGGGAGSCAQTPWVDAGGFVQATPVGAKTVITVTAGSRPTCEHSACITCGNPDAACAGIPGCADPSSGCFKSTCCDNPGFTLPSLLIGPGTLNICTRVDQIRCGTGVINTSRPQTGDNEVTKMGDTSDPGPDCCYDGHPGSECIGGVNMNDDPAAKVCNTTASGAGGDTKGKIVRTVGNGTPDASGIQIRLQTPGLSTAWFNDNQGCPPDATFDTGESLASQLILATEPTTAGASAGFVDMNGDGCASAGSNFTGTPTSRGPYTIGAPAVLPLPYGGTAFRTAAAGLVFSGGVLHDIGFIAITPTGAPTVVTPAQTCTCNPTPGCPE